MENGCPVNTEVDTANSSTQSSAPNPPTSNGHCSSNSSFLEGTPTGSSCRSSSSSVSDDQSCSSSWRPPPVGAKFIIIGRPPPPSVGGEEEGEEEIIIKEDDESPRVILERLLPHKQMPSLLAPTQQEELRRLENELRQLEEDLLVPSSHPGSTSITQSTLSPPLAAAAVAAAPIAPTCCVGRDLGSERTWDSGSSSSSSSSTTAMLVPTRNYQQAVLPIGTSSTTSSAAVMRSEGSSGPGSPALVLHYHQGVPPSSTTAAQEATRILSPPPSLSSTPTPSTTVTLTPAISRSVSAGGSTCIKVVPNPKNHLMRTENSLQRIKWSSVCGDGGSTSHGDGSSSPGTIFSPSPSVSGECDATRVGRKLLIGGGGEEPEGGNVVMLLGFSPSPRREKREITTAAGDGGSSVSTAVEIDWDQVARQDPLFQEDELVEVEVVGEDTAPPAVLPPSAVVAPSFHSYFPWGTEGRSISPTKSLTHAIRSPGSGVEATPLVGSHTGCNVAISPATLSSHSLQGGPRSSAPATRLSLEEAFNHPSQSYFNRLKVEPSGTAAAFQREDDFFNGGGSSSPSPSSCSMSPERFELVDPHHSPVVIRSTPLRHGNHNPPSDVHGCPSKFDRTPPASPSWLHQFAPHHTAEPN